MSDGTRTDVQRMLESCAIAARQQWGSQDMDSEIVTFRDWNPADDIGMSCRIDVGA
jgi:hypothetical protein